MKPNSYPEGRHCVYCTRPEAEAGRLSHRGICIDCAKEKMVSNNDQIHARRGDHYVRFLDGQARALRRDRAAAVATI